MRHVAIYYLISALIVTGCSVEKNTWTSKAYHNTTSHYNGYWYAREEINKIETSIRKAQVDDYNRILRLFPTFDSTVATTFEKELAECIKMASLAIQRHQNSKWVDDSYILVGKARLYGMDWGNAIQTFKYTNKIAKDKNTKHLAIINLVRTYIEHMEYNNAKAAIDYLQKEKLSKLNRKRLNLEKAYYYQLHNDYDQMVRALAEASPFLKKSDRRGRIYFIIGQVYQKMGFESEAYNYYKKCLSTNPEYEVDFYARLYMAQVKEISRNKDIGIARKSFHKLLRDVKNKEFRDKIYFEMGIFELRHDNLPEAIANFKKSVHSGGKNKKIAGESFLKLGEIYYDTLKNYELSQAYYDSALSSLSQDYEGYQQIKTRAEVLNEFVKHLKTIKWQDSLLYLSSLDSASLRVKVDSVVAQQTKLADAKASKKKNRSRIEIAANDNSSLFASNDEGNDQPTEEAADWYFANPSAMSLGQSEFKRIWGNVELADNWRRSMREQGPRATVASTDDNLASPGEKKTADDKKEEVNPADAEFARINKEIPRTPEATKEALSKIEEAYFKVGEIYYFKLQEIEDARMTYEKLLSRFPETQHEPEVLYTLYLILKDKDPAKAEEYASALKTKHPNSTFTKILINPDYLQESGLAAEKQKVLYRDAYHAFESHDYDSALQIIAQADALGETTFTPSLLLLKILVIGQTEDISKYQYELEQFAVRYPDAELTPYSQRLLETSRKFQADQEKRKGINYITSFSQPHYFVILYKLKDNKAETISAALETFNQQNFPTAGLNISNLIFNEEYGITFAADLPDMNSAVEYYKTFNEKLPTLGELGNLNFDNFVITKGNFDIFYRTKGLDEYLQFFEKNYPAKNQ